MSCSFGRKRRGVSLLVPALVDLGQGGSVSLLSKSFFSPLLATQAALLASMRRWVHAFSALTWSSHSLTSVDQMSSLSERHGSLMLQLCYNFTKLQNSHSSRLLYQVQDSLLAKIDYSFYCNYLPFIRNRYL